MSMKQVDHCFRIIALGDYNVGKSSLTNMYILNKMNSECCVGVYFYSKTLKVDNTFVKLELWDTGGVEKYIALNPLYYRWRNGVMLVYDVTNRQSFDNLRDKWYKDMCLYTDKHTQCILIGNKCDLESERVVDYSTGKELANSLNIPFIETSARDSIKVEQAFVLMTAVIMRKITETEYHEEHNIQLSVETSRSIYKCMI